MRLALVRKHYSPFGGAERFIDGLTSELKSRGHEVVIVTRSWHGDSINSLQWIQAPSRGFTRSGRNRAFQHSVSKVLQRERFDLVQTHERFHGANIARLGDGLHKSWLDRYRSSLPGWRRSLLDLDPYHRQVLELELKMINDSNCHLVVNSTLIRDELFSLYNPNAERVSFIPNGVDTFRFSPSSSDSRKMAREIYRLRDDDFVVSAIGSGFRRKGFFLLLQAMIGLPKMTLLIAGKDREQGTLQTYLKSLKLENRVFILGPVMDVRTVYQASDVFALPSLYDPSPNAILEALASGLPVLTSKNVGTANEIAEVGAGIVCDRNPESIAAGLSRVYLHAQKMGAQARLLAMRFSQDRVVPQWLDLYQKLF